MGSRVYLYLSLWPLLLVACDRVGWRHEALLDRAEHLLVRQPDSARALLADVDQPERLAEGEWARWALLSTWADDEASIRPTSDSTINRVVDYYARRGNRHQRAQAYYCQGRVLTGLGQLKQATTAYLQAAELMEGVDDPDLAFRILSQAGLLYVRQDMPYEAIATCRQAFDVARLAKDSLNMGVGCVYLGRAYRLVEDWRLSKDYYSRAGSIALRIGDWRTYCQGLQEQIMSYTNRGLMNQRPDDRDIAMHLDLLWWTLDYNNDESVYLTIGNVYEAFHRPDSAYHYLSLVMGSDDIYIRRTAYQELHELLLSEGRHEEARHFNELYRACRDSIEAMGSGLELYQIKRDFEEARRQKRAFTQAMVVGAIGLFLLSGLLVALYFYRKARRAKRSADRSIERQEARIRDYENRIATGERDLKALRERRDQEIARLEEELETLRARKRQEERQAAELAFKNSDLYLRFHRADWRPARSDWQALVSQVDLLYPNFATRLDELFPWLDISDRRLCYLVKIQTRPGVIAELLCCSDTNVAMTRKRLYEKATGTNGSAKDFDRYLLNL